MACKSTQSTLENDWCSERHPTVKTLLKQTVKPSSVFCLTNPFQTIQIMLPCRIDGLNDDHTNTLMYIAFSFDNIVWVAHL